MARVKRRRRRQLKRHVGRHGSGRDEAAVPHAVRGVVERNPGVVAEGHHALPSDEGAAHWEAGNAARLPHDDGRDEVERGPFAGEAGLFAHCQRSFGKGGRVAVAAREL